MKKRYVKVPALILAFLFCFTLVVSGCSKKDETVKPQSTEQTKTEVEQTSVPEDPNALEWTKDTSPFTFDQYFYASWGTGYVWKENQYVADLIAKKTGVRPNVLLPTGNDNDYLNVMIAGGDLPEVMILEWYNENVEKLIASGQIYSINELSEKYAPKLMDLLPKDMVDYHKSKDGKLYYIPSGFTSSQAFDKMIEKASIRPFFVRQDVYKAIGSPKLETPDEWIAAMKLAKEKFPDVFSIGFENPLNPTDPWDDNLSMPSIVSAFAPELTTGYFQDDKMLLKQRHPGYRNAIKFLNRLYNEGLFSKELFTDKGDQYDEKLSNSKYFIASRYMSNILNGANVAIANANGGDKSKAYDFVSVLKVDGKDPVYPGTAGTGWVGTMVTKNAKNPERIIRYLEYCWSDEGQMDNFFGKEGETYTIQQGMPVFNPDILELKNKDASEFGNKYGFEQKTMMWRPEFNELYSLATAPQERINCSKIISQYAVNTYNAGLDGTSPPANAEEGVIGKRLSDTWAKVVPKLIMAKSDEVFNQLYDEAITQMDKLGAEKLEKWKFQQHLLDLKKKGLSK